MGGLRLGYLLCLPYWGYDVGVLNWCVRKARGVFHSAYKTSSGRRERGVSGPPWNACVWPLHHRCEFMREDACDGDDKKKDCPTQMGTRGTTGIVTPTVRGEASGL